MKSVFAVLPQKVNFDKVALAVGYSSARIVETENDLIRELSAIKQIAGPNMIIVKVNKGARKELGRPTTTPVENKEAFMKFLKE